jgi:hypothetical protein
LLSASCIGAVADFQGGGSAGFGIAYAMVAAAMLLMMVVALGLRRSAVGRDTGADPTLELRTGA